MDLFRAAEKAISTAPSGTDHNWRKYAIGAQCVTFRAGDAGDTECACGDGCLRDESDDRTLLMDSSPTVPSPIGMTCCKVRSSRRFPTNRHGEGHLQLQPGQLRLRSRGPGSCGAVATRVEQGKRHLPVVHPRLGGLSDTTHPATGPAPCGESLSFRIAGRHDKFAHGACRQAEASPTIDMCCRQSDRRSNRLTRYPGRPAISPTRLSDRNSADAVEGPSSTRSSHRPIAGS